MNIKTRQILGYLGLLPFILFSLLPLLLSFPEGYIFKLLLSFYGGIIISFLGGMTWGWPEAKNQNFILITGIFFSLVGFFIVSFSNMLLFYCLLLGCISFIAFFVFELKTSGQMRVKEYKNMRIALTILVVLCYLISLITFR